MRSVIHSEIRGDNCFSTTVAVPDNPTHMESWLEPVKETHLTRTSDYDLIKEMERRGFLKRIMYAGQVDNFAMHHYANDPQFWEHIRRDSVRALGEELSYREHIVHKRGLSGGVTDSTAHTTHLDILDIRRLLS